ncbi:MAG: bifunctional acetate--CoA ligase family protein/GNAT family N-acetyltransferase [Rhodoferax sp.]|nr:bifunctional acetate--CoA ligase family protein/GNAT family N-acetyltransferase [Rhodoferax sp.]OIP24537.1 MAG: GNAT family N-acetyltransferase [Comamonadaceae bacterium CG2_30_60_41]PIW10680.1 MAG: GNAT family N-acetyltransferase [Comamonadaceae bacterium CG17_big_fil_post_rev_8_21_14_2_50_60_13]PIY24212.1 MAG: GNAT family N-acetyltransferase [Comamonadaceae bacterium CG_4_10_14_3_um_filter_60_75]PJC12027.1 MAG: GNAT family N-acetyltransferase [Comamonadaceae bacterium CG_4_9_14_0_8_um_filt
MDKHFLSSLFAPGTIAVFVGNHDQPDTQTPQARTLYQSITAQRFAGKLIFLDVHASGTLADLASTQADLAIIALPASEVAAALEIAGRIKCHSALVISTGIDAAQAAELHKMATRDGIYLLGPNSMGFQRPHLKLNASIAGPLSVQGPLALVSQSGALTSSILDWARKNAVGFSTVVSLGPNTAVDLAQVLDFLASDSQTHSIVIYMEGITNARRFMSALRAAANAKPVVVLKAGRKPAGNRAALTHSGTIVGSDDVFDAALRRAGAVRVRSFVALFSAAKCLASRYKPTGRRLAVITNGGGPGVLAADWASEIHLNIGTLTADQVDALRPIMPPQATFSDLIDVSEDAGPEQYRAAIEAANAAAQIDGILVIYSPKIGVDGDAIAKAIANFNRHVSKPLLTCWMGDASVGESRVLLNDAAIPTFRTPEAAVGAFGNLASFYQNQQLLQQTPPPLSDLADPDVEGARLLIESVLAERRRVLTEMESKALLAAFHIPVTKTLLARSANEAMMIATQLGFPVALKIDSPDISHKSDVQGVALNILNAVGVRDTFLDMMQNVARQQPNARINGVTVQNMSNQRRGREVCVGVVTDEPFGPVIAFGAGGTMIELINDRTMELPPLNQFLARRMIERSRVAETLEAWRGALAADVEALEQILLRVSEMVCELPQLREMDINPIIVDESGALAVDARIVVDNVAPSMRHYNHLAILPYPSRHEQICPMAGGGEYLVRPVHPDDAQMLQHFVRKLSPESRYFRFVSSMQELPATMLSRFTLIDYDREMALVALVTEESTDAQGNTVETSRIVGVSRYITNPDRSTCEFSLVVADEFKGKGLGSRLMLSIMDFAREKGLTEIEGLVLANNPNMLKLMKGLGFAIKPFPEDTDFKLVTHHLQAA